MNRNSNILAGLAIAAAGQSVAAHLVSYRPFIYFFKPLATLLILALALANAGKTKLPFARWIALGLFFSLCGDILLIWPNKWFLPGLAVFLLAHVSYLAALTRDAKLPANTIIWLALLAVAVANFVALRPYLPKGLEPPVAIYAFALATMVAQAIGRALLLRTVAARFAAIGASFFLVSDTLLAYDRFHSAIPLAPLLILAPYYAAQLFLALSTLDPFSPQVTPTPQLTSRTVTRENTRC